MVYLSKCFETYLEIHRFDLLALQALQVADGSFKATVAGSESDMRFLYCACAISTFLKNWTGINIQKAVEYILSCYSYEGGFSLRPGTLLTIYFELHIVTLIHLHLQIKKHTAAPHTAQSHLCH